MKMLAVCCLLLSALCLRAELAFKWTVEVSQPLPYAAEALQGESFNLEAKVVQYRVPMLEAAEATFYYQTSEMEASQWYTVPAAWDATTATASVAFTPAMDVGSTKYRFFFGIETAQGKNYRVFGTLRLKASPGFSPATLKPTDVRAEMIQEILEAVFEEADDHYATKEEHAALAVQVQGKADASHTHSDLVKQRDVQQVLNESEFPVSAKAVYQNVGNVVRNPDIVDVVRYVDAGSLQEIGDQHGKAIFAADSDGQGGIIVGGSRTSQPCWTQWTAKLNWDKIRAYNDPGLYEDYSFKPGESNQIARIKDLPTSTFTEPVKIQNGQGTGSLWIGGNVNSGTLTNNQRHLARIVVPTFSDVTKGATLLGFDSSGDENMSVANKGYDAVSFGGMKKITNATSPMAIGFCVTKTRGAMSANDKVYPMEMDANEVRFNVRTTVNGAELLTVNNLPTMSMEGLSLSGQNGSTSFSFLSDGGVIFSTTAKGDTRSATLVGQAALAGKADAQHTHAFEEMAVTVSGASYRWQWDETEGTFALVAEE